MEDLTQRLPHDALADVLRRLQKTSPCSLAASRCVCKAWRTVVDTRWLLTDLLPHSLTGIFFRLNGDTLPGHFSLDASAAKIAPFDYLDTCDTVEYVAIRQHCNGLLLLFAFSDDDEPEDAWVVNPATQQWTHLPTPSPMCTPGMEDMHHVRVDMDCHDQYLVFNPTVSPHYEVFLVKYVPFIVWPASSHLVDLHIQEREWPPSTFVMLVYIEKVMHSHDRYLVFDPAVSPHYEVFLVKRFPCLHWPNQKIYMDDHVTEREWPPSTFALLVFSSTTRRWEERPFIRQGEAAVTIGYMLDDAFRCAQCHAAYWRWALYVHQNGFILRMALSSDEYRVIELPQGFCGSYLMDMLLGKSQNGVYFALLDGNGGLRLRIWCLDETCDQINWTSKCDIILGHILADFSGEYSDTSSEPCYIERSLLGFHPNEETVFLLTPLKRVVAYHFDTSMIEDLGCLPVEPRHCIYVSFPYTLCLMGEFPSKK